MKAKLFRYSISDSLFQQVTYWYRTVYPFFISDLNKIGFSSYTTISWMNPNGTNRELLFKQPAPMLAPVYNFKTKKIYFYVKEDPLRRRLGSIDLNSENFRFLLPNTRYQDAGPAINTSGDSLLFYSNRSGSDNIHL